jgi:hypothetical protein
METETMHFNTKNNKLEYMTKASSQEDVATVEKFEQRSLSDASFAPFNKCTLKVQ